MHKLISVFIFFFFLFGSAAMFAQQGSVEMQVNAFARDSGKVQVEVYYTVMQGSLFFEQKGDTWIIPIDARVELSQDNRIVASQSIRREKIFKGSQAEFDSAKGNVMLDGIALVTTIKGSAKAALIFHFAKNQKGIEEFDTIKRNFFAPFVASEKFSMSGIELASTLSPTQDKKNPFEKVGYLITPNPSQLYTPTNSKLCYYAELYIPASVVSGSHECEIITRVLDGEHHEVLSNKRKQSLTASIIPLIGYLDIDGLAKDSYRLEIEIHYSDKVESVTDENFYYDDGMKLAEEQPTTSEGAVLDEGAIYSASELSRMSEFELQEKGDQAMYLGTGTEQKEWKKLKKKVESDDASAVQKEKDIAEERRFIFDFWRTKDKQATVRSPLMIYHEYYKNVDEVNRKFTLMKTPGWETDFGRVYLTYGKPSYVYPVQRPIDAKPNVHWTYYDKNIRLVDGSNADFYFVDRRGDGRFELVHSNVQGEMYEADWYTKEALQPQH